ncbi:phasin family protein [Amaricoccus sp.]|uniref:phasin family protein n=1 Tax=Amaricoccus sp. TaxID=1872485 RepID=UPI001B668117|nr:phasin family protein [Amaricoccus sp.]MBP7241209.1 phasin family protein [Amaricoccus sp.]
MSSPKSTIEAKPTTVPAEEASVRDESVAGVAATRGGEPVEEISTAVDSMIDQVTVNQQQAIESLEAASATMFESVARVQRRIAEFVSDRIRQDMEAQQELLRCKSFDEVRDVQSRFFRTAVSQYSEEATRIFRLGGEVIGRTVEKVD